MAGQTDWLAVGRTENLDDIREWILTGYLHGKPFAPYIPTLTLPQTIQRVVDVGCGLGRNFPYLKSIAANVVGFDLPPMIERCRSVVSDPAISLTSDWRTVSPQRFDLVFSTLVLQHVEPAACRAYLADFAKMAPVTYLLTRLRSDADENVLDLVRQSGAFDAGPCREVEHDPATNQLRVLREWSLDELSARTPADQAGAEGHVEVMLRSNLEIWRSVDSTK